MNCSYLGYKIVRSVKNPLGFKTKEHDIAE